MAILALGFLARPNDAQAQTVIFDYDPSTLVVTSITLSGPITFTAATNYIYSGGIQVRIFDLYPTVSGTVTGSTTDSNLLLTPNSVGGAGSFYAITTPTIDLGGGSGGDIIIWNSGAYSFSIGQTLSLSGTTSLTTSVDYPSNPLLAPTSGTYSIYLASQSDGTLLTNAVSINISAVAVPEPSTFAAMIGGGLMLLMTMGRSRSLRRI